jgi:hypothetical protein
MVSAGIVQGWQKNRVETSVLGAEVANDIKTKATLRSSRFQCPLFDFGERAALVDAAKQASVVSNIAFTAAHRHVARLPSGREAPASAHDLEDAVQ